MGTNFIITCVGTKLIHTYVGTNFIHTYVGTNYLHTYVGTNFLYTWVGTTFIHTCVWTNFRYIRYRRNMRRTFLAKDLFFELSNSWLHIEVKRKMHIQCKVKRNKLFQKVSYISHQTWGRKECWCLGAKMAIERDYQCTESSKNGYVCR
jgi:hypothetical protein